MPTFFQEFKKRKLWRVMVTYPTAAFIVIEAVALFSDRFDWDDRFLPLILILLIGGFPLALIWNWYHGKEEEQNYSTREKVVYFSITFFTIVFTILYWSQGSPYNTDIGATIPELNFERENSIAVLPLHNQSSNEENAFFADGIHDGLLTSLSKVRKLLVLSRTSTLKYRDTDMLLPDIAKELGVAYIVEGGVQRSGDRIRINVQLIEAATDKHIWAETYDRSLSTSNIFDIQSEIVLTIVEKLKTSLTSNEENAIKVLPTSSIEAYDLYLKARRNMELYKVPNLKMAISQLNQAIALDSQFVEPQFALIDIIQKDGQLNGRLGLFQNWDSLVSILDKFLIANPNMAEALSYRGLLNHRLKRDSIYVESDLLKAIEIDPNCHSCYMFYGIFIIETKSFEYGEPICHVAYQLNPKNIDLLWTLSVEAARAGYFDKAFKWGKKILAEDRDSSIGALSEVYQAKKLADTTAYLYYQYFLVDNDRYHDKVLRLLNTLGAKSECDRFLHVLDSIFPNDKSIYLLHYINHYRNQELEEAEEWFEKMGAESRLSYAMIQLKKGNSSFYLNYNKNILPRNIDLSLPKLNYNIRTLKSVGDYASSRLEIGEDPEARIILKKTISSLEKLAEYSSHYANLAIYYGYLDDIELALLNLKKAEVLGFSRYYIFEYYPQLEQLRNTIEYKKIKMDFEAKQKPLRENFRHMMADPNTLDNILKELEEKY